MTNEEAFEHWFKKEFGEAYDPTEGMILAWEAAIAYMQERSEKMTNEEAFRKWRTDYESDYDKKPSYLEVWQSAIAYMQEQNKSSEQSEPVVYAEDIKQLCRDFSSRNGNVYIKDVESCIDAMTITTPQSNTVSSFAWALIMETAASFEVASYSISDEDAKKSAEGAIKYAREMANKYYTSPPKQAIPDGWMLVPIESDEQMKDGARAFLTGLELGIKSFENMTDHLRLCGAYLPDWFLASKGHINKMAKAHYIYDSMLNAAPTNTE